jgi:hypothetical protein
VDTVTGLLAVCALCHIFLPRQTSRWLTRPITVRGVGVCLILLALPCLLWRGWYFCTLFAALFVSGVWRAAFPAHSIRAQESVYPRWVHGLLLLAGAAMVWAFF